jgi:hypothetical protein
MFDQSHETYESLTAQTGVYCDANPVQAGHYNVARNTQADSFYTETVDAFTNLSMIGTSDKALLSTLTSTNAALTGQMAVKDRVTATLHAHLRNTNSNMELPTTQTNY